MIARALSRSAWLILGITSAAMGCVASAEDALPDPLAVPPGAAEIAVEVYEGLRNAELLPPSRHLLLDVRPLVDPARPPRSDGELSALASEMLRRLQLTFDGTPELHPFLEPASGPPATQCPAGQPASAVASSALEQLQARLQERSALDGARVLLAGDLSTECAVQLCAAAGSLVSEGGWLDVVQLGPGEVPRCLQALRVPDGPPKSLRAALEPERPPFRVESASPRSRARVIARGRSQGPPIEVGPGYRTIVVELDPEERIGPVRIAPGQRARIRLMDFPLSAPGEREWQVEVERATR